MVLRKIAARLQINCVGIQMDSLNVVQIFIMLQVVTTYFCQYTNFGIISL